MADVDRIKALRATAPFKYLPSAILPDIAEQCTVAYYPAGGIITRKGDITPKDVYIICQGRVHRDYHDGKAGSLLGPGSFFGDRAPLFNEARRVTFTAVRSADVTLHPVPSFPLSHNGSATQEERSSALETAITLLVIPGELFVELVMTQLPFAVALARMLRTRQHLFDPLDSFMTFLFNSVSSRSGSSSTVDLKTLVAYYREMQPAVHSAMESPDLDTGAWLYAIRRLPANITAVSTIVCSTKMLGILDSTYSFAAAPGGASGAVPLGSVDPPLMGDYALHSVKTSARRRTTIVLMHGKIFVLLRDATTDLLDFATCLCCHIVESGKLRAKILVDTPGIVALRKAIMSMNPNVGAPAAVPIPPTPYQPKPESRELQLEVLRKFGRLTEAEITGLLRIFPDDCLWHLNNVIYQHSDYSLFVDRALDSYDADISEVWVDKVAALARELMGDWTEEDLEVDIISSNTHSVLNLLSPFLHSKRDEILAWGKNTRRDVVDANPVNEQDLVYILSQFFFRDQQSLASERAETERQAGIRTMYEEEFTGISLQLFDPSRLDPLLHDEFVNIPACQTGGARGAGEKRRLIVNIDFAFGRQADEVLHCLILLFQQCIRSVNVLGKAGGLIGQRGDILIPTHVLLQTQDILTPITNAGLDPSQIARMSGHTVHIGPVLTIEGTMLQNRPLLHYYRRFYHAVGLEMEGSYFARRIVTCIQMGLLRPDVETRFIYYISDIPLDSDSTLAKSLAPWESIPSLYTTARVVLEQIFARSMETEAEDSAPARQRSRGRDPSKSRVDGIAEDGDVLPGDSGSHLYPGDLFAPSAVGRRSPLLDAFASSSSSVHQDGRVTQHSPATPSAMRRQSSAMAASAASLVSTAAQRGNSSAVDAGLRGGVSLVVTNDKPGPAEQSSARSGVRRVNTLTYDASGGKKEVICGIDPLWPVEKGEMRSPIGSAGDLSKK